MFVLLIVLITILFVRRRRKSSQKAQPLDEGQQVSRFSEDSDHEKVLRKVISVFPANRPHEPGFQSTSPSPRDQLRKEVAEVSENRPNKPCSQSISLSPNLQGAVCLASDEKTVWRTLGPLDKIGDHSGGSFAPNSRSIAPRMADAIIVYNGDILSGQWWQKHT